LKLDARAKKLAQAQLVTLGVIHPVLKLNKGLDTGYLLVMMHLMKWFTAHP